MRELYVSGMCICSETKIQQTTIAKKHPLKMTSDRSLVIRLQLSDIPG